MKATSLSSCFAMRFYHRFDYGIGGDNHLKDLASAVALGLFCSALALWIWMMCAAVIAYRAGYPL